MFSITATAARIPLSPRTLVYCSSFFYSDKQPYCTGIIRSLHVYDLRWYLCEWYLITSMYRRENNRIQGNKQSIVQIRQRHHHELTSAEVRRWLLSVSVSYKSRLRSVFYIFRKLAWTLVTIRIASRTKHFQTVNLVSFITTAKGLS